MRPLKEYLLISPNWPTDKTATGILIGYQEGQSELTQQLFPNTGRVLALGAGVNDQLNVGDEVYYLRWGATELEDGNIVIHQKDVIAKICD